MNYSDSHAHLGAKEFASDRDEVVQRAKATGLKLIANCTDTLDDFSATIDLKRKHPEICLCCLGLHPDSIPQGNERRNAAIALMEQNVDFMDAVGEIGLDFHYGIGEQNHREQRELFASMLDFSSLHQLPAVIHCREARDDLWEILRSKNVKKIYLHCYEEDLGFATKLISSGFDCYFGFNGILTFKSADSVREVCRNIPLERLLIETDSPCLSPVPFRGQRNEPMRVIPIAQFIADLRGIEVETLTRVVLDNAKRFYGIR